MINKNLLGKLKSLVGIKQKNDSKHSFKNWSLDKNFTQNNYGKVTHFDANPANDDLKSPSRNNFAHWWSYKVDKTSDGSSITHEKAYEHYCDHCEKSGYKPHSSEEFGKLMRNAGAEGGRLAGRYRYWGLRTMSDEEVYGKK